MFYFLRLPLHPEKGSIIKDYTCAGNVRRRLRIQRVNHTIEVAAGIFDVIVLEAQDDPRAYRHREYWNERYGLIRMEVLTGEGDIRYHFDLSEIVETNHR
jgi:hypothetical protein